MKIINAVLLAVFLVAVAIPAHGQVRSFDSRWEKGQLVYVNRQAHMESWLDAYGNNVQKSLLEFTTPVVIDSSVVAATAQADTARVVCGDIFKHYAVSAGTGLSVLEIADSGYVVIKPALNENDGLNLQSFGAPFYFDSTNTNYLYFGARVKLPDSLDQSDFILGLCVEDQTLIAGVSDGIYFQMQDVATGDSLYSVTEFNSVAVNTQYATVMADASWHVLEFFCDGANVNFYVDNTLIGSHTTQIPADMPLYISAEYLNGVTVALGAVGLTIDWIRVIQID